MRVYFFSLPQNLDLARKLQDKMNLTGYETKLFDNDSQFFERIMNKSDLPDLIVYDYLFFNHNIFNIYDYMKMKGTIIPLVFFNEPTLHYESSHFFWKNVMDLIYTKKYFQWEKYSAPLKILSDIIDENRNSTSSETKPFTSEITIKEKFITELKGNNLILFNVLNENINKTVQMEELRSLLKKNDLPCKETTIFCLISRLRKTMEKNNCHNFEILKNQSGYMMVERKI